IFLISIVSSSFGAAEVSGSCSSSRAGGSSIIQSVVSIRVSFFIPISTISGEFGGGGGGGGSSLKAVSLITLAIPTAFGFFSVLGSPFCAKRGCAKIAMGMIKKMCLGDFIFWIKCL